LSAEDNAKYPTYELAAAAAFEQAEGRGTLKGTMHLEVDVRQAMWWRVRSLQRVGYIPALLGILGLDAAAVLAKIQHPQMPVPFWIFLLFPLTVVAVTVAVFSSGRARALARVARLKSGLHVRYVLLHSHSSAAPWLVFFPEGGEGEATSIGALKLSYGPVRHYYRNLPKPAGRALLKGEVSDGSTVVPWIDGQAVWPAEGFKEPDREVCDWIDFISELTEPKPFSS
jgi:hypothetical protein